jgi:fructoselysine-6-P-deglycase FrlB-like protein
LLASYESNFNCLCVDPAEIIINPTLCQDKRVCFISISGKTKENILAAKKAKKYCTETIAITANPFSDLAKSCMKTITLDYQKPKSATAGTLSFIVTSLTLLSLINRLKKNIRTELIYQKAEETSAKIMDRIKKYFYLHKDQSVFFLGNSILFPISSYGSLKVNEVFGVKSFAYSLEQFCHSPLFSISNNDIIIIFSSKNQHLNEKAKKLGNNLNSIKIKTIFIEIPFKNTIEIFLMASFIIEMLIYRLASEKGMNECYFLENKKLLKISSELIYN